MVRVYNEYEFESWKYELSCPQRILYGSAQGVGWGFLIGATQMVWNPDSFYWDYKGVEIPFKRTWMFVFNNMKIPMVMCGIICGTYCGVECIVEQLRDDKYTNTYIQGSAAGAAAGLVIGSITKRPDIMFSLSLGMGAVHGLLEINGHTISQRNYVRREGDLPNGPSMSIKKINPVLYQAIEEFKKEHPEEYTKLISQDVNFYSKQYCKSLDDEIYKMIEKLQERDLDMKLYWPKIIKENPDIAEFLEANDRVYKWSEQRAIA